MRARPRSLTASIALVLASASAQAPLDVRIALVIGNASYLHVPALTNSGNDAKDVGVTLQSLGFTVEHLQDGNRAQMLEAIARVREKLNGKQGLGMLYYAGHGIQVDWRNFMLPVEMKLTQASDVPMQGVDVGTVIDAFKSAGTRMNVLVLDACRDNPFSAAMATGKGLAPMDAPPGTLLAYATAPGNVADDGAAGQENGLYTQYLLYELRRPQARIEDVFKRVRLQVRQKSQGRQIPWESTSLEEEFSFNEGAKFGYSADDLDRLATAAKLKEQQLARAAQEARSREQVAASALARQSELAREAEQAQARLAQAKEAQQAVELALQAKSREQALIQSLAREQQVAKTAELAARTLRDIEQKRLRDAEYVAAEVKARDAARQLSRERAHELQFAAEKAEWDRIKDLQTSPPVYAFLDKYPSGYISELAQVKLERVDKPQIVTQPDKGAAVQSADARRFRKGDRYAIVISDLLTKIVEDRTSFYVVAADEDTAEFNQGYKVTQSGAIIRTIAGATHDPYQQWIPAGEYQVGKKWTTRTLLTPRGGATMWAEIRGKVVARETITVPAGTFDTYRMEMEQMAQDGTRLKITYWGQPEWGVAVKQIREVRERNGRFSGQVYEMTARTRGS